MKLKPGLYEHFKGGKVIVLGSAKHTEAHHLQLAVYRHIDDPQLWVRPVDMFTQSIQRESYKGPRFWQIGTLADAIALLPEEEEQKMLFPDVIEDTVTTPEPIAQLTQTPRHDASMLGQKQS